MGKIQKTFEEDTEVGDVLNWVDEVVWAHVRTRENRDSAEWQYITSNKIKITIEVYGEQSI